MRHKLCSLSPMSGERFGLIPWTRVSRSERHVSESSRRPTDTEMHPGLNELAAGIKQAL